MVKDYRISFCIILDSTLKGCSHGAIATANTLNPIQPINKNITIAIALCEQPLIGSLLQLLEGKKDNFEVPDGITQ